MVAGAIVIGGAVLATWWATEQVAEPPADPVMPIEDVTYTVQTGEIGRSLGFNGFAKWETETEFGGFATGLVTEMLVEDGAVIDSGDIVMSVDLGPTVVAQGAVPAFRALASGTEGGDVVQLQQFLADISLYSGPIDGKFGTGTRQAVKAWQDEVGMADDGVVDLGELVFVRELPARVRMLVSVGTRITSVETAVLAVLADEPQFWVPLAAEQQQLIPPAARVDVQLPDGRSVAGMIDAAIETDNGVDLRLRGADGALCDAGCDSLSVSEQNPIDVTVELVPVTTGAIVPLAAIEIESSGIATVELESGATQPVEIIAEDRGLAVIDGVEPGTNIILQTAAG